METGLTILAWLCLLDISFFTVWGFLKFWGWLSYPDVSKETRSHLREIIDVRKSDSNN